MNKSPTLNTWGNMVAKSYLVFIITPLLAEVLNEIDMALWSVSVTVVLLQLMSDFGLQPTVIRLVRREIFKLEKKGGTKVEEILKVRKNYKYPQTLVNLVALFNATKIVYCFISLVSSLFIAVIGWVFLADSFEELDGIMFNGFLEYWMVISFLFFVVVYLSKYGAIAQAVLGVAAFQRIQMLTMISASFLSIAYIVFFSPKIIVLIIFYEFALIASYLICKFKMNIRNITSVFTEIPLTTKVFFKKEVWSTTWRSGLGMLFSVLPFQLSGLVSAKFLSLSDVMVYNLTIQIARSVSTYSQSPFYSNIPSFLSDFYEQKIERLRENVQVKMSLVYLLLSTIFWVGITIIYFKNEIPHIPEIIAILDVDLLIMFLFVMLFERYSSMHLQIYTLTNNVIWHIINGISLLSTLVFGVIYILLFDFNIFIFPCAYLAGMLSFSVWKSPSLSYKLLETNLVSFEIKSYIPILFINLVICLLFVFL